MIEVNGGDDIDMETVQVKPTCKEALTAAFTLQKYITDINEPFACKLEGALASFGYQTRMEGNRMMEATVMYHPHHALPVHSRAFLFIPIQSLSFFHVPVIFRPLIITFRTSLSYSFIFLF